MNNLRLPIAITLIIIALGIVFQENGPQQIELHGAQKLAPEPMKAIEKTVEKAVQLERHEDQKPFDKSQLITKGDPTKNPFSDTDSESLEGRAAASFHQLGIIKGFENHEFRGSELITREQASNLFFLISPHSKEASIPPPQPSEALQRDAFLAMLSQFFQIPTGLPHRYQDVINYPGAWFWNFAGVAYQYDLFPGEKTLNPAKPMTRGEFVVALYQYLMNK